MANAHKPDSFGKTDESI